MVRFASRLGLGVVLATGLLAIDPTFARTHAHYPAHHHRPPRVAGAYGYPYGSRAYNPTPTCYGPGGTPYDPDIIGGRNHVGDGGPAVNLGGFNPCGY